MNALIGINGNRERLLERLRRLASPDLLAAALLLLGTVVALAWANSPVSHTYAAFWHAEVALRLGSAELRSD